MKDQETARTYDYMSALWVLSSLIGRWSVIPRPRAPVYLNMYMILAAESGITRKSTAISVATNIIRQVMKEASIDARLIESSFTAAVLSEFMTQDSYSRNHCHVIISASELAAVLGKGVGTSNIPALLTDLYDCPKERRGGGTISRGEYNFANVYVTFMAASTPSWMASAITPAIIEGGFTSRCLFVIAAKPKAMIAWPTEGRNAYGFDELVKQATRIVDTCPKEIGITTPALDIFTHWYNSRHHYYDPFRASFASREDAHTLRVAGLLSISDERYEINAHDIRTAIELVTWCREEAAELFVESSKKSIIPAITGLAGSINKLRDLLINAGSFGLHKSSLYNLMRREMPTGQLNAIMEIMHELQMVQQFILKGEKNNGGRPLTVWRATKNITSVEYHNLLLERLTSHAPSEGTTVDVAASVNLVDGDAKV